MTQPKYAPVTESAEVRPMYKLPVAGEWTAHRPADYAPRPQIGHRPNMGSPGPDQGYALRVAEGFADRLQLTDGEHSDDVLAGAVIVALRRAASLGRAPVSHDIEMALHLFGYLDAAAPELVATRKRLFAGIAHDYWQQRDLADLIPESTLKLSAPTVRDRVRADPGAWRALTGITG
jgi:hypothetical protein